MFHLERRRRTRTDSLRAKALAEGKHPGPLAALWALVLLATTGLLTGLVGLGGPPFPYRLGQRTDREVRLRVDIQIPNPSKFRNLQEENVKKSLLVFQNDPEPNRQLEADLVALADRIRKKAGLEEVAHELVDVWKIPAEEVQQQLDFLAASLADEAAWTDFRQRIDAGFGPILDFGVLDPRLPLPEKDNSMVEVYTVGSEQPRLVSQKDAALGAWTEPGSEGVLAGLVRKLREQFPNEAQAQTIYRLAAPRIKPTLKLDDERTLANEVRSRSAVQPVFDEFKRGDLLVSQGGQISDQQLLYLRAEHEAWNQERSSSDWLGLGIVAGLVVVAGGVYVRASHPAVACSPLRTSFLCLLAVGTVGAARLLGLEPYRADFLPLAMACLFVTVAYDRALALAFAFGLSLLVSLTQSQPMPYFIVLLGGTAVGVIVLDSVRSRTKLITVGFFVASAYAVLTVAMNLLGDQPWSLVLSDAGRRFASGLIASFLVSGGLPYIESVFGIMTDISLIELADTSHPLLRDLVRLAPGTYNHSVTVSIIGEAAANRIGCNALLVRVGALFHDIGKMLKPHYFVENISQNQEGGHEGLEPAMSTLIIIGHVKDGMDLAREHHLPRPIIDMIEQHHGTTLVGFFYQEAAREQQSVPEPEEAVEESSFRYPGPRPQSKETAVLMLADCVEGASRALSEPTPARIEKLVHKLALDRLMDGQFNESGLTLAEVEMIEESLIKSLTSVYHGRIRYPMAV